VQELLEMLGSNLHIRNNNFATSSPNLMAVDTLVVTGLIAASLFTANSSAVLGHGSLGFGAWNLGQHVNGQAYA